MCVKEEQDSLAVGVIPDFRSHCVHPCLNVRGMWPVVGVVGRPGAGRQKMSPIFKSQC